MALTKTTVEDTIDAWQAVVAVTLVVGTAESISASYDSTLYIEVAPIEAVAQVGVVVIVEVSYGTENWVKWTEFTSTAITAGTTTINDGAVTAGDLTLTLTDATTANFDDPGQKWFIKDGTIANSESVRTVINATNTVTIAEILERNHADSLNVYDHVDNWAVKLPLAASQVRVLYNNIDGDCDVAVTSRISKVTALS